jgi:myo-inositol-1(or 4)-monophosphatase
LSNERFIALQLACKAEDILRRGWNRQDYYVNLKGPINPATEIDHQSEHFIVDGLRRASPDHSILAEEETIAAKHYPMRWIIDPLDGTVNYIHHIPMLAVSIGLEKDGEMVLGVVFNHITEELFVAEQGYLQGAALTFRTQRPIFREKGFDKRSIYSITQNPHTIKQFCS